MNHISRVQHLALTALITIFTLFSQAVYSETETLKEDKLKDDLAIVKDDGFYIIPALFYKPETSLAGVLAFLTYFRTEEFPRQIRPSTVATIFTYTVNQQFIWQLFPEIYLANERYQLLGALEYLNYPNIFYGIGNNTAESAREKYASDILKLKCDLRRETLSRLYMGLVYQFEMSETTKTESGGLLDSGSIPGGRGSKSSGLGFSVNFDNRDSSLSTTRGGYYMLSAVWFGKYIGSEYKFGRFILDARQFISLFKNHVLALQGYACIIEGTAPFELLSKLGGKNMMRGIFEGRYRDDDAVIAQIEYRLPIWWRFGMVLFASYGDVAHTVKEFKLGEFKYTFGGGFRYCINPKEKLNARVDVGRSKDFTGVYVAISEAF
jgi:hypothetical protein